MTQKDKLYRRMVMCSLMLDDIILYLDTHPDNRKALAAFAKYRKLYEVAKMEYEAQYGPVTAMTQPEDSETWLWSTTPWPWESEVTK